MEALNDVVKAGKAMYLGASSMFAWQFAEMQSMADYRGWHRFISMQNHYNLVYREEERDDPLLPLYRCRHHALVASGQRNSGRYLQPEL